MMGKSMEEYLRGYWKDILRRIKRFPEYFIRHCERHTNIK